MHAEIREESAAALAEYARISIGFEVDRVLDALADPRDANTLRFVERRLRTPYRKDYDRYAGNHPRDWELRFDLSGWALLAARVDGRRVGGAAVACRTRGIPLLEGQADLAVLWDLRVAPGQRGNGIGSALFRAVEEWAVARGCRRLAAETQNTNVNACRFYASHGCRVGSVTASAYPDLPGEIQIVWFKDLTLQT